MTRTCRFSNLSATFTPVPRECSWVIPLLFGCGVPNAFKQISLRIWAAGSEEDEHSHSR